MPARAPYRTYSTSPASSVLCYFRLNYHCLLHFRFQLITFWGSQAGFTAQEGRSGRDIPWAPRNIRASLVCQIASPAPASHFLNGRAHTQPRVKYFISRLFEVSPEWCFATCKNFTAMISELCAKRKVEQRLDSDGQFSGCSLVDGSFRPLYLC